MPVLRPEPRIEVFKSSPEMLASDHLQSLHAYWRRLRGSEALPRRDDLSPVEVGPVLGQVTIVEVLREPLSFCYRLIGTRIEELGRLGDQGKMLDQIRPAWYRQLCREAYEEAVRSAAPFCLRVCCRRDGNEIAYERMVLPFTRAGTTVEVLLDALDWPPGSQIEIKRASLLPSAKVPVDLVLS